MEDRELVLEVPSPDAISLFFRGNLNRALEIGFVEDVMTTIKLLTGVGYSGMFDVQPDSARSCFACSGS